MGKQNVVLLVERRMTKRRGKVAAGASENKVPVDSPAFLAAADAAEKIAAEATEALCADREDVTIVVSDAIPFFTSLDTFKKDVADKAKQDAQRAAYVKRQNYLIKLGAEGREEFALDDPDADYVASLPKRKPRKSKTDTNAGDSSNESAGDAQK